MLIHFSYSIMPSLAEWNFEVVFVIAVGVLLVAMHFALENFKKKLAQLPRQTSQPLQAQSNPPVLMPPRKQHYLFVHRVLPEHLFGQTDRTLDKLFSPDGSMFLCYLWDSTGAMLGSFEEEIIEDLDAKDVSIADRKAKLVRFPEPVAPGEGHFALILPSVDNGQLPRYVVLEMFLFPERPDAKAGVLCEWFSDGSRCNHEIFCDPDERSFLSTVTDHLNKEAARERDGADGTIGLAWKPGPDVNAEEAEILRISDATSFRYQHCVFAFQVIPKSAQDDSKLLLSMFTEGRGEDLLQLLWQRAGEFCKRYGERGDLACNGLTGSVHELDQQHRAVFITMPEPLGPPEARFLLLVFDSRSESLDRALTFELTTENSSGLLAVGEISDSGHAIVGSANSVGLKTAISMAKRRIDGQVLDTHGVDVFRHILSIARASSLGRKQQN